MIAQTIPMEGARRVSPPATAPAKIALLGSGTVGGAVLRRLDNWRGTPLGGHFSLVFAANTRLKLADPNGLDPAACATALMNAQAVSRPPTPGDILDALGSEGVRILIDATADSGVAVGHPQLLESGVHVATACKVAGGTSLSLWRQIQSACARRGTGFGDRATVGAGLPLLTSLRELQHGGDRIHAIAGVMSGSLAWLFDRFDGTVPFSELVREARAHGFTEPDPRDDLSGEDVRRKILILARAAGFPLETTCVRVQSLVPPELARLSASEAIAKLELLDPIMSAKIEKAQATGGRLQFVARLQNGCASVGPEILRPGDPLTGGRGTDNRVAIWSDRYRDQPLVIQGPGAGAKVTAAALLDDALRLYAQATRHQPSGIRSGPVPQ